jgi:crossover junction endodeoxyribonuclease RuvC
MRIVGVDPGIGGALALYAEGTLFEVVDMPVFDGTASGAGIAHQLGMWLPDVVVVEYVQPMPKNGSIASFSLGKNFGVVLGVAGAMSYPLVKMRPNEWKRRMGLQHKTKSASRGLATELWPTHAASFRLVKNDGRAEAALIARAHAFDLIHTANEETQL